MVTRCARLSRFTVAVLHNRTMSPPDWYDPKLYRRKKPPADHEGGIRRRTPSNLRLVRHGHAPLARFVRFVSWCFMWAALLFVLRGVYRFFAQ